MKMKGSDIGVGVGPRGKGSKKPEIAKISQANISPASELKSLSQELRDLAEKIEAGEIVAVSWIEHRTCDKFRASWVKARGVSMLELLGGASALVAELNTAILQDD